MLARQIAIAAGMVRKTEGEKRGMIEILSSVECQKAPQLDWVGTPSKRSAIHFVEGARWE